MGCESSPTDNKVGHTPLKTRLGFRKPCLALSAQGYATVLNQGAVQIDDQRAGCGLRHVKGSVRKVFAAGGNACQIIQARRSPTLLPDFRVYSIGLESSYLIFPSARLLQSV